MNQYIQRRVRKIQLYYNTEKKYITPTPSETGKKIKYDIPELRIRPEKLTKRHRYQEEKDASAHQESRDPKGHGNTAPEWIRPKNKLGEEIQKVYPLSKKQRKPEEPASVTRLKERGDAGNTPSRPSL